MDTRKELLLVKTLSEEVSFKTSFEGKESLRAMTESGRKRIPDPCTKKPRARPQSWFWTILKGGGGGELGKEEARNKQKQLGKKKTKKVEKCSNIPRTTFWKTGQRKRNLTVGPAGKQCLGTTEHHIHWVWVSLRHSGRASQNYVHKQGTEWVKGGYSANSCLSNAQKYISEKKNEARESERETDREGATGRQRHRVTEGETERQTQTQSKKDRETKTQSERDWKRLRERSTDRDWEKLPPYPNEEDDVCYKKPHELCMTWWHSKLCVEVLPPFKHSKNTTGEHKPIMRTHKHTIYIFMLLNIPLHAHTHKEISNTNNTHVHTSQYTHF